MGKTRDNSFIKRLKITVWQLSGYQRSMDQLLGLMAAYFGQTVAVLHSSLSTGERYDQWKRVRSGDARLVVGTRSAIFAPGEDFGLIILDEEQEHSYKSENSPRYSAKEVAIWRGSKEKALVLLGSATPSVETMYRAKQGVYHLFRLYSRYGGRRLPDGSVVDMREELKLGNDMAYSIPLREAILDTWEQGKQLNEMSAEELDALWVRFKERK